MIINPSQFDYEWFSKIPIQKRKAGNQRTKKREKYLDIITAFDIETTVIKEIQQSVMYIWQWQFSDKYTVIGRTWDEFVEFRDKLFSYIEDDAKMVTFIHNASYEFQFLKSLWPFEAEDVFAMDSRKVLKFTMGKIEFRCSYLHSNMSLDQYLKKMKVEHKKLSGKDFDYSKERFSWTELSKEELDYCINDVLGLVEAITYEMKHDNDNLYTFPLTSTGYVRRDVRKAMKNSHHNFVKDILPDYYTYAMLREAYRGGNTHCNRLFADKIINNVKSADRSSSYPDVLLNCEFPIGKFYRLSEEDLNMETVMRLIFKRHKACIMRVCIFRPRLSDRYWGCPYLSKDKCRNTINAAFDNGRILHADYLETTITDIDLKILLDEYEFDDMVFLAASVARYGPLPRALKDCIIGYYEKKTALKGSDDEDDEYLYTKSKNKLNSIYGLMCQDPAKQSIIYDRNALDEFKIDYKNPAELLEKSNKTAFLPYTWGVWTTAWARLRLEEGIRLAKDGFIYCDTDSVKYIGDIDWEEYNNDRQKDSEESGALAMDHKGIYHYMGVYEFEGEYEQFASLGAKKYVYKQNDKLHVTIAGVNKLAGADELEDIRNFKQGFIFTKAGGTESVYNDLKEPVIYNYQGHDIKIISNLVIKDSTYTLGITAEYERLLTHGRLDIDR